MIATQAIPRGAEVVNCYGQLSSSELLRGYGFVEQHNSKEHAQVPVHFLLKAAAAAAASPASPALGLKQAAAAGGATAEEGEEERLQLWSDSDSDSDDDELPEIDFEDDHPHDGVSAQAAARAAAGDTGATTSSTGHGCPGLQEALQQLGPCWEEAWLLAHHLQLLPTNGVFTVDTAGAPAPQLVALMQLLLLSRAGLQSLYAVVKQQLQEAATNAAADAGATQPPPPAAAGSGGRRSGQQKRQPGSAPTPASQAASTAPQQQSQQVADSATEEVLGEVTAVQLQEALQRLCRLMVSRYTCSMEEDEALLQQLEQLPPRKAAAVVARTAEKRCWAAFEKVGGARPQSAWEVCLWRVSNRPAGVATLNMKFCSAGDNG
jgi:hypothetical protein